MNFQPLIMCELWPEDFGFESPVIEICSRSVKTPKKPTSSSEKRPSKLSSLSSRLRNALYFLGNRNKGSGSNDEVRMKAKEDFRKVKGKKNKAMKNNTSQEEEVKAGKGQVNVPDSDSKVKMKPGVDKEAFILTSIDEGSNEFSGGAQAPQKRSGSGGESARAAGDAAGAASESRKGRKDGSVAVDLGGSIISGSMVVRRCVGGQVVRGGFQRRKENRGIGG
ncbi:hypothetical protein BVRB_9g225360 [Beta vulgaris subsp. vulgaris]|uniref:Uncharacterized protein n=1 Tax=Beta vulgaris subsp. vulgaris TaxID=3555 RepID=A0A0J8B5Y1_BETVV|nr:hypothetical protein BVRB_9g225360 [Beta vulgaris subsp. vulgaris]